MGFIKFIRQYWQHLLALILTVGASIATLFGRAIGDDGYGSLSKINTTFILENSTPIIFVFIFALGLSELFIWLQKRNVLNNSPLKKWEKYLYGKRWRSFVFVGILWFLIAVTLMPATTGGDVFLQFEEVAGTLGKDYFWNVRPSDVYPIAHWISDNSHTMLTNQHGFLLTALYGGTLNLSYSTFGSLFPGMLFLGLSQFLLIVFAFSEAIYRFCTILTSFYNRIIFVCLTIANPLVIITLVNLAKNPLFSGGLVLTLTTVYFVLRNDKFEKGDHARVIIGCFMMLLGVKWALPVVIIIIIWLAAHKSLRKNYKAWLAFSSLLLIIASPYIAIATNFASADDKIESKTIQIQQLARLAKLKPDAITTEEKKSLNKILDVNNIGDLYNPFISDPVKSSGAVHHPKDPKIVGYRWETVQSEDWEHFNKTWLDLYKKEPGIFNDAFVAKNIAYFDMFSKPWQNISLGFKKIPGVPQPEQYDSKKHKNLQHAFENWSNIPVLSIPVHGPFYLLIFIFMLPALLKLRFRYYVLLIPMLIHIAIELISPVNGSVRYTLGFVYMFPILLALVFAREKKLKNPKLFVERPSKENSPDKIKA